MPGREITAIGRVQGIGYRWFVQDCATQLGITGYVRNRSDGSVEIVAIGSEAALEQFTERVRNGHRYARISNLVVNELTHYSEYEEFFIA